MSVASENRCPFCGEDYGADVNLPDHIRYHCSGKPRTTISGDAEPDVHLNYPEVTIQSDDQVVDVRWQTDDGHRRAIFRQAMAGGVVTLRELYPPARAADNRIADPGLEHVPDRVLDYVRDAGWTIANREPGGGQ